MGSIESQTTSFMKHPMLSHVSEMKLVIFDVDGTLYNQKVLRKRMLGDLLRYYALRPLKFRELLILKSFREERELLADKKVESIERAQYEICAEKTGASVDKIRSIIDHWMFEYPLRYLGDCVFPGVHEFFQLLKKYQIHTAIYSDYEADGKMVAMGLEADKIICSTDEEINRLKPDPKGLLFLADYFKVSPEHCLFIGDRDERDGEAARNAGMPYQIIDTTKPFPYFELIHMVESEKLKGN